MSGPEYFSTNICLSCRHYYLTYELPYSHGCRVIGFKASKPPYLAVLENSGMPCQWREPKTPPGGEKPKAAGR